MRLLLIVGQFRVSEILFVHTPSPCISPAGGADGGRPGAHRLLRHHGRDLYRHRARHGRGDQQRVGLQGEWGGL